MKHLYKILSIMLIVAFIFSFAGCTSQDIVSDTNSIVSNVDNSSEITSTDVVTSTEGTSSGEDETSSEDEISSNTSSNTSSTVSKPTTNTSSTASNPSQNTSSTKPLSWKEEMEAYGFEVFYDENVKLYYYETVNYVYEDKYDGINYSRSKSYSNWDPVLKMYYEIIEDKAISYYDKVKNKRIDHTDWSLWDDKYYSGYWKIDYKLYTDSTVVLLKEYEYEEDTSVLTCEECGKVLGNGTNGTCNYRCTLGHVICLYECKICGAQFKSYTCHSCPEQYKSDLDSDAAFEILEILR